MKSIFTLFIFLGMAAGLAGCAPYNNYYPPVTVNNPPVYNPPPASNSMHYGPPAQPVYPSVTVSGGGSEANSMHYGN